MNFFHILFFLLIVCTFFVVSTVIGVESDDDSTTSRPLQTSHPCIGMYVSSPRPESPLIPCRFVVPEFVVCEDAADVQPIGNDTSNMCAYFGPRNGVYALTNVTCEVLPCIECNGPRRFRRKAKCVKYTGHYFLSTLLYSIFLGIVGVDRFCLGYSAVAVGKLMTLGGLGVWWVVDIFLLINGSLMPADESQWMPHW